MFSQNWNSPNDVHKNFKDICISNMPWTLAYFFIENIELGWRFYYGSGVTNLYK